MKPSNNPNQSLTIVPKTPTKAILSGTVSVAGAPTVTAPSLLLASTILQALLHVALASL